MNEKLLLWTEFGLLFFGVPAAYAAALLPIPKIPVLVGVSLGTLWYLWKRPDFDKLSLLHTLNGHIGELQKIGLRSLGVGIFSICVVMAIDPKQLFAFPSTNPMLWLMVMILYPLLSAWPQEIIYRGFLIRRYRPIFTGQGTMIASVIAFSFLHVIFDNWVAVILTIPAGYLFTRTYLKTGSIMLASIEHAAYGCVVFTTGLGHFFYKPS